MDGSSPHSVVVKTTCPYCGTGCGVDVRVSGTTVEVSGDPVHPTNAGRLCVKGSALGDTVGPQGRLLYPAIRRQDGDQSMERVSWDAALDHVAQGFRRIIEAHGPDAVAWYVSGQLLTEDYYVANKLAKGFVGTANIDTNSRLCMSSAVAGHKRAFGEDIVPVAYDDLELADLVVLVGSNTAWCHPILFQRIVKEKERRPEMKLVVIDPRRTATTEMADLHLPLRPGTDVWLFNGLLSFLHQHGVVDTAFVEDHTTGLARAMAIADNTAGDLRSVAAQCKLQESALSEFYRLFARTDKVITAFSMGVNQSSAGTDKVNAIINCHLLSGRIGKPGAGPFSITGQPNAMGGREVGGLSNMLAAHMDIENAQHRSLVREFWQSPTMADKPGLKAVDLFDAIDEGRVKAVWIMATNPVVSMPDADKIKRALSRCELVVVSDVMAQTDTTAFAHVVLPAQGWGEKSGTVTNSERCISRLRSFLPPIGEARPDWWALSEVARRWGHAEHFAYTAEHEVFDEHCRLTAAGNRESGVGDRDSGGEGIPRFLNLSGLVGMDKDAYDGLRPVRWPVLAIPDSRLPIPEVFSDGRFYTPDRRARFVPTAPHMPVKLVDEDYPLVLNTGRVRDHWHTMTRTGLSPRLASHVAEPFVDLHPQDALLCGVREDQLARISSRWGSCVARVRLSGEMQRKSVFVPIHWNAQFASDGRVGSLVNPVVDPVSGEPEFKHTPVRVEPFMVAWHGFALSRDDLPMADAAWWTRITGSGFTRYELAGRKQDGEWTARARAMLGVTDPDADWLEYEDRSAGVYRGALIVDDRIAACVFVSPRPDLPSRAWLSGLFTKDRIEDVDRMGLLVGEPFERGEDTGVTVCSCFGVGRKTIERAIRGGCHTPKALGAKLKCGTNCGSCVPELKSIIAQTLVPG
ncbi:assimilatory nitrate reductase (NADH) alpha subunit apoprotein [Panacagrimonas perspica]|uniref:Assimilatory nitrate reductase (NADH) alpha subunit apoprotein n=1 Tax=Panacagrimonas perspica TaxID=381431 RepID=A0A4S3JYY6_9GAMM|nr:nitrate reductase [Panacagrimonas perspica]TDU31377.1 assimilatory nitrate reductase (NADH) alpha subunit apoprotein [Panacagrimonas perspica]THD00789.1 nitrate reductase [Panacagrimonas perspica]